MSQLDPYHILNLKNGCSTDQVRAAFRRLSKTMHPDVGGTIESFNQLAWAHDLLTDEHRQEWWDEHGWDCGPEKDRQALAITILQNHLRQILGTDEGEPTHEDLVKVLTTHLDKEIVEGRKLNAKLDRAEKRVAELMKRFKRASKEGNSVIHSILESELRQVAEARRQNQQQEAAREELKRMLSEYKFTWDNAQQVIAPQAMGSYSYGTGGTAGTGQMFRVRTG